MPAFKGPLSEATRQKFRALSERIKGLTGPKARRANDRDYNERLRLAEEMKKLTLQSVMAKRDNDRILNQINALKAGMR